jgi:DNA modification methylase
MDAWHQDARATIYNGDCLEVLRALPDASVDAVVTDPPYGLEFMGKEWDAPWKSEARAQSATVVDAPEVGGFQDGNGGNAFSRSRVRTDTRRHGGDMLQANQGFQSWCEAWAAECLRVLKPGGHLLAFGGTRTWHRLACAIEDAGFEVRDSIAWMYGSGFPKSLDVSKAIDKRRDDYEDVRAVVMFLRAQSAKAGHSAQSISAALGWGHAVVAHFLAPSRTNAACPSWEQWQALKALLSFDDTMDAEVWRLNGRKGTPGEAWESRPVTGIHEQSTAQQVWMQNYSDHVALPPKERRDIPVTDAAREWSGWGTALKPAHEPIVVARKPLVGTVAANVLEHGTGALNIDACRIQHDAKSAAWVEKWSGHEGHPEQPGWGSIGQKFGGSPAGRWPANVVLDEDQAAELDRQSGVLHSQNPATRASKSKRIGATGMGTGASIEYADRGGASRFFYVAKAPARERPKVDGTAHPTVKPLTLMRWLCRLVTPPDGVILEPFAGSGTTVEAALLEGFRVVAIEREADYLPLIQARLDRIAAQEPEDEQLTLDASA